VELEVNTESRISEIHDYLTHAAPVDGSYVLFHMRPNNILNNPNLTIKQARLSKSQITQKIL
jgi:hypothetical protein